MIKDGLQTKSYKRAKANTKAVHAKADCANADKIAVWENAKGKLQKKKCQ